MAAFGDLASLVQALDGQRVAVIGDLMLDRFVFGEVSRISPEAPVPVLAVRQREDMPGGAGNVCFNLAALGVKASIVALCGDDSAAAELRALLDGRGVDTRGIATTRERPTGLKVRYLAHHQQLLRVDEEAVRPASVREEAALLEQIPAALAEAGAVILSDYKKGAVTDGVIRAVIDEAGRRGIPVLVDPKGSDFSRYRGATVVTPNRKELGDATRGHATGTDGEVEEAAREILAQCGIGAVVATRAQDGLSVVRADRSAPLHIRTEALEVFDVSGAGDTVIATLAAAMAAGGSLEESAALANLAGGIVVAKVGTASVRAIELLDRLARRELVLHGAGAADESVSAAVDRTVQAPLYDWDQAVEEIARWRARGLRIGLTNGCFDLLHYGHVSYLNTARSRCDRLIVALNADESVRRLKGPTRPVNDEFARATVIGALGAVDMVVLFGRKPEEKDTASEIVRTLKPDVYFKGADYTEDRIPEAAIVRAYGGDVQLLSFHEGHSTTGMIERMIDHNPEGGAAA